MKKFTTLLGISAFVVAVACGSQESGMDETGGMDGMDGVEPSSQMMEADSMAADTMMADSMEGMSAPMTDEGGMDDGGMGGGV
jgi:hypothetical protein